MSNIENPHASPSISKTFVSKRPLGRSLWLVYFCSLVLVVVTAAGISHFYIQGYPTETFVGSILFYPTAFLFLLMNPSAWPFFLSLPALTVALTIAGFKRQSRTILALSLVAAFAASIGHACWIQTMMGC